MFIKSLGLNKIAAALLLSCTAFFSVATAQAETVKCSFYSTKYDGRRTANGQRFSSSKLTAAHKTLPFGTRVKLTNPNNHHSVVVRVTDRGPFVKGRDISVTRRAARRLGITRAGVADVEIETLK